LDRIRSRTRRPRKRSFNAGVDHVGTTLRETAAELRRLATIAAPPASSDAATVQARA
jgi:hypothetical protein